MLPGDGPFYPNPEHHFSSGEEEPREIRVPILSKRISFRTFVPWTSLSSDNGGWDPPRQRSVNVFMLDNHSREDFLHRHGLMIMHAERASQT